MEDLIMTNTINNDYENIYDLSLEQPGIISSSDFLNNFKKVLDDALDSISELFE